MIRRKVYGVLLALLTVYSTSILYCPRRKMNVLVTVTPPSLQVSGTVSTLPPSSA